MISGIMLLAGLAIFTGSIIFAIGSLVWRVYVKQSRKAMLEDRRRLVKRAVYHWYARGNVEQAKLMIDQAGDLNELDLDAGLWMRVWEVQRRCTNLC